MPEQTCGAPLLVAQFRDLDVPCDSSVLNGVREGFDRARDRYPSQAREIDEIIAGLPGDPDATHRYLLDLRKKHDRHSTLFYELGLRLDAIRSHSRLYTSRTCWCLHTAWRTFIDETDPMLAQSVVQGFGGIFTVTSGSQAWGDMQRDVTVREVCEYAGFGPFSTRVPAAVTIAVESAQRFTLTVAKGVKSRPQTWCFERLDERYVRLANRVRYSPHKTLSAAGSWVLQWPAVMVEVLETLASRNLGNQQDARELLVAGIGDLSEDGAAVITRLAEHWAGTMPELVRTAATVASPAEDAGQSVGA